MDIFNKKIVFHIHTKYSHDSNLEPALIVDTLFKGNISAAIITDHNSIQGAIEAKSYAEKKYGDKFNVIVGEEVKTDIGDIIGFPLKDEIQLVDHLEVISNIKSQGGYVCLPHPYKSHNLLRIHDSDFIELIDFIEIFNRRFKTEAAESYGPELFWLTFLYVMEGSSYLRAIIYKWLILSGLHKNMSLALLISSVLVTDPLIGVPTEIFAIYVSLILFSISILLSIRYYLVYTEYFSKMVFHAFIVMEHLEE